MKTELQITTDILRNSLIELYNKLNEVYSLCDKYEGQWDFDTNSYLLKNKDGFSISIPEEYIVRQIEWDDDYRGVEMLTVWVAKDFIPKIIH